MDSILPRRTKELDFYGVLFLLLQIVACLNRLLPVASAKTDGVCVSPGGRFPPYSIQGKPPRRVSKGPNDLTLCRVFRKKTCCDVSQTHPALLSIRRLASTGEASDECLHLWELLECSICDPNVGVQGGSPVICPSLCDRIYDACSTAYFAMDAKNQVLAPCGISDTVCGRASEWVSNGTELCKASGFSVKASNGFKETFCYGGKASLESVVDSWGTSSHSSNVENRSGFLFDFRQWVREMPINEQVSWAVGGLVLTAGLLFVRFTAEDVSGQNQVKASVQRKIRQSIADEYPGLELVLDDLLPKKSPLIVVKCQNHLNLVVVNNVPLFFNIRDGPYMPTLRLLHQYPTIMKKLQVDRGAIKFVLAGANIMCPGLTSPGGVLDDEVGAETPVAIMAEGKQHALAIGFTKLSAKDIKAINKGIGVDNMHYLNDGLWKMERLD